MTATNATDQVFPTDATGLPACRPTDIVQLADGDTFDLRIAPTAKHLDGPAPVRMLAYNGSIPGPTLRVRQGSAITVRVRNDGDHETTVHWHGLRLDNAYDGVPEDTQAPIPVGGEFTYRLRFPDDGVYWYHPHVREDYGLEMGLYGNLIVDHADIGAWAPVNREAIITLDDVLVEDGRIAPFRVDGPTHTAMGRFGNVMLTAGATELQVDARAGEVVRFFLTNTANTRIFNLGIPGARMKRIGGDNGRCEHEEWVDAVLLAPSERAVVDVLFENPGAFPLAHQGPDRAYLLGTVRVSEDRADRSLLDEFETLHDNDELVAERDRLEALRDRPPDKTLLFDSLMPILYGNSDDRDLTEVTAWTCPMHPEIIRSEPGVCPICGMKLVPVEGAAAATHPHEHEDHADTGDGLEWEDLMPEINARTDSSNMIWKLVDADTGQENGDIDWTFRVGDRVKIRLDNTGGGEHPMHHPFHIHGAGRFLVLSRDDVPDTNLMWKDTVLVRAGEAVDIAFDATEPGLWMAHCHIAEHNQNGMMFGFRVT
jgi:FtsP/CotA-like multicopper oxidase with cupredoxin domain